MSESSITKGNNPISPDAFGPGEASDHESPSTIKAKMAEKTVVQSKKGEDGAGAEAPAESEGPAAPVTDALVGEVIEAKSDDADKGPSAKETDRLTRALARVKGLSKGVREQLYSDLVARNILSYADARRRVSDITAALNTAQRVDAAKILDALREEE